jgi:hypothetical protein
MWSKPVALGLLAVACITGAVAGSYVARHTGVEGAASVTPARPATSKPAAAPAAPTAHAAPVAQPPAEADTPDTPAATEPRRSPEKPKATRPDRSSVAHTVPPAETTGDPASAVPAPVSIPAPVQPVPEETPLKADPPEPAPVRRFEEVQLPTSSVIGLQVETSLSSERARIEDRVEARVTRDVVAQGRVAIPAGSRVLGSVTLVDRGGKVKERARLGIRFHTLVLADGTEVQLNTEPFYRDGESPAGDSAKKIGGAAAVGAILGGILGGGKGAVIGGSTGAAGGTAATMAGDRNPATLASGSIVTIRLASPVSIEVERREPQ